MGVPHSGAPLGHLWDTGALLFYCGNILTLKCPTQKPSGAPTGAPLVGNRKTPNSPFYTIYIIYNLF